jgi:hypothetical protein
MGWDGRGWDGMVEGIKYIKKAHNMLSHLPSCRNNYTFLHESIFYSPEEKNYIVLPNKDGCC